ncbi:nucleotide exchange factor GrpE [bacterium]|nr:nucleotide exchange factor GrpE [bacterium]
MWYDNENEKINKQQEKAKAETEAEGTASHSVTQGVSSAVGSAFSGSDPTKAFDDDDTMPGGQVTDDEVQVLKKTIKQLEEKSNLNYDRYLRALAELENYKKRMNRDRTELLRYAGEDLLLEILPVVDNLERTLEHTGQTTDVKKVTEGIELIYRQFVKSLEKSGVSRIDKAPCIFDPAVHQALQRVEDKSVPDDTVVVILQKGYTLNGKVVRPAMVKVAKH